MDYTMNDDKKEYNDKNFYHEKRNYSKEVGDLMKELFTHEYDWGLNKMICSSSENKTRFFYQVFLLLLSERVNHDNSKVITKIENMRDIYRRAELANIITDSAFELGGKLSTPEKFLDNLKNKIKDQELMGECLRTLDSISVQINVNDVEKKSSIL